MTDATATTELPQGDLLTRTQEIRRVDQQKLLGEYGAILLRASAPKNGDGARALEIADQLEYSAEDHERKIKFALDLVEASRKADERDALNEEHNRATAEREACGEWYKKALADLEAEKKRRDDEIGHRVNMAWRPLLRANEARSLITANEQSALELFGRPDWQDVIRKNNAAKRTKK
jgi:hypothetical protein